MFNKPNTQYNTKPPPNNFLAVLQMGEEGSCQFKCHLASSTNFSTQQRLLCFHLPVLTGWKAVITTKLTNPLPLHFWMWWWGFLFLLCLRSNRTKIYCIYTASRRANKHRTPQTSGLHSVCNHLHQMHLLASTKAFRASSCSTPDSWMAFSNIWRYLSINR